MTDRGIQRGEPCKGNARMRFLLFTVSPVSQTVPAASAQKDETGARAAQGGSGSRDGGKAAGWDTPSLRQQQAVRSVQAASWMFTLRFCSQSGLTNPPSVSLHIFSSAGDYREHREDDEGGHRAC